MSLCPFHCTPLPEASAQCAECQLPICSDCRVVLEEASYCRRCIDAARAQALAWKMSPVTLPTLSEGGVDQALPPRWRIGLGLALGLAVAGFIALSLPEFLVAAKLGPSLLPLAIGFPVGLVVALGGGARQLPIGLMAGGIGVAGLHLAYWEYAQILVRFPLGIGEYIFLAAALGSGYTLVRPRTLN